MQKKLFFLLFFLIKGISGFSDYSLLPSEDSQKIIVHNRILAKVNGKTISVLDVMKKMDVFLNRYYPQLADNKAARYQYYSAQWKEALSQMIDNELILADAEKVELKVTDAEVRETVIERFGPNIMSSLDKLGLTYEEARKMIHTELVVQKMTWFRIHSKALQNVNPQDIKSAYKDYCLKNPSIKKWEYQVLSIRTRNDELGKLLSNQAHELLKNSTSGLTAIAEDLKHQIPEGSDVAVLLSEEQQLDEKSISDAHREVLSRLPVNAFSEPIRQLSRFDQSIVYRIFHLKKHYTAETPSFDKMSEQLKEDLLQEAIAKESSTYIAKLRDRFGFDATSIQENFPVDFQPFALE